MKNGMTDVATDNREPEQDKARDEDKSALEKIAQVIDPPGREISDAELSDPGANTPAAKPNNIRSEQERSVGKP